MYEELVIFGSFIFLYSIFAKRIETSLISGPMVFVSLGLLAGPQMLNWFAVDLSRNEFHFLVDITLALVLFIDAAKADLSVLRQRIAVPTRMLLLGMPCVIALGTVFALWLFPLFSLYEAMILATILAATDAALAKGVINSVIVPGSIRQGLNVESGLNDGLCVPVILILIALAEGSVGDNGTFLAIQLVIKKLGIALIVGLGVTWLAGRLMIYCSDNKFVSMAWLHIAVVALAVIVFGLAETVGGSGYIAAFTGGLLFGSMGKNSTGNLVQTAKEDSEALGLLVWLVFGAAVVGIVIDRFTLDTVVYALLSLSLVRMVPMFIVLSKSGESYKHRLFLGWFGPRGLASIVFAIIVMKSSVASKEEIVLVVVCTVFISLFLHGFTANPLSRWLVDKK